MNIDQEWMILVRIAERRANAGIEDTADRAILEVNKILDALNQDGATLAALSARLSKEAPPTQ